MTATITNGRSRNKRAQAQHDSRRAAIYVRISLDATGEGLGVQRQEEDAHAICSERGWEVVGVYRDNSISASNRKVRRPGYEALRRDYAGSLFDAVVCYDLDRLTRQPRAVQGLDRRRRGARAGAVHHQRRGRPDH